MPKSFRKSLILFLCLPGFFLAGGSGQTDEMGELLNKIEQSYANLNDLQMSFKKETESQIFTKSEATRGSIFIKQPNKFRLESSEEVIVSDGKFLWNYAKTLNQVTKQNLKKGQEFSFLSFVKDIQDKYQVELSGSEKVEGVECRRIILSPRQKGTDFEKLTLWVDGKIYLIRKMETEDLRANVTTFRFAGIKVDTKLKDGKFLMQLPKKAELVDLTEP